MAHHSAAGVPPASALTKLFNPVIGRMLRAGLPFGPNVLMTVRGRSSGRQITFPVAIIEFDGRRLVQSPFGEVNWVRNLRVAGEATIHRGRRREVLVARELRPDEGGPALRRGLARYLESRYFAPVIARAFGLRRDSPPAAFVEVARSHPMFELHEAASDLHA